MEKAPKRTMNYIGSKHTLLFFISNNIYKICSEEKIKLEDQVFADLFAGTHIVGRFFKPIVKSVIANDIEYYSYIFGKAYIENHSNISDNLREKVDILNNSDLIDGFIFNNYAPSGKAGRIYFSDDNARKIDSIRTKIEQWYNSNYVDEITYWLLLCSLIEAADKIANTTSVYGAYLKKLKKSALEPICLQIPEIYNNGSTGNVVYNDDISDLISKVSGDILYLDPPYNKRQYGSNYHILNTIGKYDNFIPKGKTGLREYTRSNFCSKKNASESLEHIISNASFKYIFLSYNNEGIIPFNVVKQIMKKHGEYRHFRKKYNRYKADNGRNYIANYTNEYLHFIKK